MQFQLDVPTQGYVNQNVPVWVDVVLYMGLALYTGKAYWGCGIWSVVYGVCAWGGLAEGLTEGSGGAPHWNPMATAPWVTVLLSETSLNPNSFSVTCCPFGRRNWPRTLLSYITAPDDRAMEYNPLGQREAIRVNSHFHF